MTLQCKYEDPYPKAGPHDITRIDVGYVPPQTLLDLNIPGKSGEENLFVKSPWGRMTEQQFFALAESLKKGSDNPAVTIFVEKDGQAFVVEGNHRLRAAVIAKIDVLVEIRYFGNSQEHGLII